MTTQQLIARVQMDTLKETAKLIRRDKKGLFEMESAEKTMSQDATWGFFAWLECAANMMEGTALEMQKRASDAVNPQE